jgi:heterotetrameric sarcosine oxidase gamma subunit
VADHLPIASGTLPTLATKDRTLVLVDESSAPKWRVFDGLPEVRPGTARSLPAGLTWSVTPGEWTILGQRPNTGTVVDLTHVRAMFRLTGDRAVDLLAKLCALDFSDGMFPHTAAARTLLAGVATEIVRHDQNGTRSYLLLPSRSFGRYVHGVIADAGSEFGLAFVSMTAGWTG